MDSNPIADWTNYLTAQAGAAATLTGLVFVAVSINLPRILTTPGLTGRAAESLIQLFSVLLIATTVLIPHQPQSILGAEILSAGILLWSFESLLQLHYLKTRTGHPLIWLLTRIMQTQLGTLPFCISGILMLRHSSAGYYWLAPGFAFSMISGVVSAWVLLIEILR